MAARKAFLFGAVGLALAAFGSAALAQDAAKVLEQRQALMKAIGGNMKALNAVAKGESSETPQDVARRANEINAAARQIAAKFQPEVHVGNVTGDLKTTASDRIWKEPEQFTAAANKLELASVHLATAADSGDTGAIKSAIADLAKTCGGCHEMFRVKKK